MPYTLEDLKRMGAVDNGMGGYTWYEGAPTADNPYPTPHYQMKNANEGSRATATYSPDGNGGYGLTDERRESWKDLPAWKQNLKMIAMAVGGMTGLGALGGASGGLFSLLPGGGAGGGGGAEGLTGSGAGLGDSGMLNGFESGVPTAAEHAAWAAPLDASLHASLAPYAAGGAFGGAQAAGSLGGSAFDGAAAAGGLSGLGSLGGLAGPAAALAGGLLGSQGQDNSATQTKKMDPRLDQPVYGDLIPRTQGLLNTQMPVAQQSGDYLAQFGRGLLSQPVAGNGFPLLSRKR